MNTRDDIDPAKTWVISDTHFGHENIKRFCHRPDDVEQLMMEQWARAVPASGSTLLHVGDLCYRGNAQFKNLIAPHLTGERKLLVTGNHDKQRYSFYRDCGFKLARPFEIIYDKFRIQFSHYPWNAEYDESVKPPVNLVRVHGHVHNNGYTRHEYTPYLRNHINVSVELLKYRPTNLKALLDAYLHGDMVEEGPDWYDGDA